MKKACKKDDVYTYWKNKAHVCGSGIFTGVCPAVRFEVGALGVHFVAAGEVAAVNSPLFQ